MSGHCSLLSLLPPLQTPLSAVLEISKVAVGSPSSNLVPYASEKKARERKLRAAKFGIIGILIVGAVAGTLLGLKKKESLKVRASELGRWTYRVFNVGNSGKVTNGR